MKRRKPIPEQGHEPKQVTQGAFECQRCHDYRRKDQPWRRPCVLRSKVEARERKYRGE